LGRARLREAVADLPQRIVSLVPSHTETLAVLGLGGRVVGRTRFCVHPKPWVDAVATVGGTKDAKLDKVLALRPDLVVADKDENPIALVDGLRRAGVEVIWSDIAGIEDAAAFVRRLGDRCGASETARERAHDIRNAAMEAMEAGRDAPVFCPIWHPWMAFDGTAYPSAMLAAVGLRNVLAGHKGPRYFEVGEREVREAGADWTLLPTEPFPFHKHAVDTSGLGACGRPERVRIVDGEALTWFGVRTASGLRELARLAGSLRAPPP
jgi:ABC-type hemin transport system substrate-binding protein